MRTVIGIVIVSIVLGFLAGVAMPHHRLSAEEWAETWDCHNPENCTTREFLDEVAKLGSETLCNSLRIITDNPLQRICDTDTRVLSKAFTADVLSRAAEAREKRDRKTLDGLDKRVNELEWAQSDVPDVPYKPRPDMVLTAPNTNCVCEKDLTVRGDLRVEGDLTVDGEIIVQGVPVYMWPKNDPSTWGTTVTTLSTN